MNRLTRTLSITAASLLALTLAACTGSPRPEDATAHGADGYPVTVTSCGTDYTYDRAPERVLLGAPGIVRTLDELGVADSAIGYTLSDYAVEGLDEFPNLTVTSADYTPSREFLISAQPDLFLSNDEQQLLGDGAASVDDLGAIPANLYVLGDYCVDAPAQSTLDVVYDDIEHLGAIYNVPDSAASLVEELKARVTAATAPLSFEADFTAGAVTIFDGKVYALGGSYYAAILHALGLTNGFADLDSNWSEITPEAVLASDLDVILVTAPEGDATGAVETASELFANAPAAQHGRIVAIDDTAFQSVGVAIVDVIEETAAQLAVR
ncbi:iron complex transport system substrate-binding protein [Leucobacter luti]|uniref:Iron complex transport system substrate-binding protein n=1 Tax=Leucobacter luti TaxID=340320 RepID=A0A4V3CYA8_9MICO|nr:ABC transporter substrate-binding protein [Leucobacter luti]TDP93418.1 iron complex transport system substrate-binding protein [Leucobacter luti]